MIPPSPFFSGPPPRPWWAKLGRVLWVSVPAASFGFLAWVPPLGHAVRRQTLAAWAWFAGYLGAGILEVVLADAFQTTDDQGNSTVTGPVLLYVLALMAGGSVHAGLMTRPRRDAGPVGHLHGFGHRHGSPYGGPGGPANPLGYDGYDQYGQYGLAGPTRPMGGHPLYQQAYDQVPPPPAYDRVPHRPAQDRVPQPGIAPLPPPLDGDAAEVQAGLRELRESLERGEDR
jgi:hypothetical protein